MISIVIPVYNAQHSIYELVSQIIKVLSKHSPEIILVNDNSVDNSHQECIKIYNEFPRSINYIKLRKNVGEHNSVMAGLKYAKGDWILIMDDDFQNPPEEALKLVNYAKQNKYDVIYGNYIKKKHSFFRNLGSKVNDLTANYILKKPKNLYLSSFKCFNRSTLKEVVKYKSPDPYIDGLILSITSNIGSLDLKHSPRKIGKSNYSFIKLIKLYVNISTNFSTLPIHIFSLLGITISLFSAIYGFFIIIERFINPEIPPGYSSIIVSIFFFSGIQLIFLGLIGEYLGKILKNVNQQAQYHIGEEILKKEK
jgi:glycosyltransferase involved in cell wall biosynthesis